MLCEEGMADEGPQPAELDDAGRLALPLLTPAKDVITKFASGNTISRNSIKEENQKIFLQEKSGLNFLVDRAWFACEFFSRSSSLIKSQHGSSSEIGCLAS